MNEVTVILERAKNLISDENNWCKGHYSVRTSGGISFCALGALHTSLDSVLDASPRVRAKLYLNSSVPLGWGGIAIFNDDKNTTHADIMALYDRAIELSKSDER